MPPTIPAPVVAFLKMLTPSAIDTASLFHLIGEAKQLERKLAARLDRARVSSVSTQAAGQPVKGLCTTPSGDHTIRNLRAGAIYEGRTAPIREMSESMSYRERPVRSRTAPYCTEESNRRHR